VKYAVVYEQAPSNWAAYVPDLPGCVATGSTRAQATSRMHEAIRMHVAGLREDRLPIPKSSSTAEFIAVP